MTSVTVLRIKFTLILYTLSKCRLQHFPRVNGTTENPRHWDRVKVLGSVLRVYIYPLSKNGNHDCYPNCNAGKLACENRTGERAVIRGELVVKTLLKLKIKCG